MPQEIPAANQILDAVMSVPDCRLEQLASLLPELTPAQLFREVKRLSQAGHVRVVLDGRGIVTVRTCEPEGSTLGSEKGGASEWHRCNSIIRR